MYVHTVIQMLRWIITVASLDKLMLCGDGIFSCFYLCFSFGYFAQLHCRNVVCCGASNYVRVCVRVCVCEYVRA